MLSPFQSPSVSTPNRDEKQAATEQPTNTLDERIENTKVPSTFRTPSSTHPLGCNLISLMEIISLPPIKGCRRKWRDSIPFYGYESMQHVYACVIFALK